MSTRGYVTLIDEKKNILMSAYLSSDAYPSYYGLQILDALEKRGLPGFIQDMQEQNPEDKEMVEGIRRDWYIKRKGSEDQYYVDYAYEFDPSNEKMDMYYFGQKALTVPLSDLSLYREIFQLDGQLTAPLKFDPVTCTLKKDFYPELRRLIRDGTTVEALHQLSEKPILYMNSYRLRGWDRNSDEFAKDVYDSKTNGKLRFYASRLNRNFGLYVQTPFFRAPLGTHSLMTPTSVEKAIASLIRDRPDDIRGTMSLFQKMEDYKQHLFEIFAPDDVSYAEREAAAQQLLDKMQAELQESHKHCTILGDHGDSFSHCIRDSFLSKARTAQHRASLGQPPLTDQITSAGAKAPKPEESTLLQERADGALDR